MKRIFNEPKLDDAFEKKGYITVDLLNETEIAEIKALANKLMTAYSGVNKNVQSDYDLSFFRQSPEVKQKIFNELWHFFEDRIATYLPDYEPLIINMFNKKPGTGEVPIHQNWTFVDEDQFTSVSVWIPLCDVTTQNGTLEVVPGTHKNISKYRSPSIPWVFRGLEEQLKKDFMEPLNLKVGQVGIIDDSVIHYSRDNHSDENRPTIQLILKPKKADALHYLGDTEDANQIKVFKVDASFFMSFDMNDRDISGKFLETKVIDNPPLTLDKLNKVFTLAQQ